jgi:EAL domain-containing protein (putative c-di-GMP-specific phosphodiesterase class I)
MNSTVEQLTLDLAGAVDRDEIVAFYQPQIDIETGVIVSAEALSRWMHPALGMIPPATFIPIAEENGFIDAIGDRMLAMSCESAASWQVRDEPIEIAVNVSAAQLDDAQFAERLIGIVRSTQLSPHLLTIEVTESREILDTSAVADRLDWLRSVGVTISVDDFGTGHSSIDQLLRLRATELKIDQSLIQDESPSALTLLTAVIAFARDRGLRVVAEGVESETQFDRVRELHCDRAQGYLLGRPIPKDEFELLLAHTNEL